MPRLGRLRVKHVLLVIFVILVLDYFGTFTHFFETDFGQEFKYPLEGDIPHYVYQVRHGKQPDVAPLNTFNFTLLYNPRQKCKDRLRPQVVFLIKSAVKHFKRRNAIRSSWGHERRFSDVTIRTVFLLGVSAAEDAAETQNLIDIEANNFEDIVQANFLDTYYNNTLKTMTGIRWAVQNCPTSRFYMFVDDDYYVSTKNVLRYVRNPLNYPNYIEEADEMIRQLARRLTESNSPNITDSALKIREIEEVLEKQSATGHYSVDSRKFMAVVQSKYEELKSAVAKGSPSVKGDQIELNGINNNNEVVEGSSSSSSIASDKSQRKLLAKELSLDAKLFSGFVMNSSPHRHKTSKWHISLDEYPYDRWPTYVSAGGYVISREALIQIYYGSWFTKLFR